MNNDNLPTYEQLLELYEAAEDFKKAKPWDRMYDSDIICVENPTDKSIGYCSVMGRGGEHFALGVYLGDEGIFGYNKLLEEGDTIPNHQLLHYQNCIMCSYEDRELLTNEDRKQIKELGFSFRGRNAWPMFRRYEPGFMPWHLNGEECVFLTHTLRQTLFVINTVEQDKLEKMLEEGKSILRYSKQKNGILEWESKEIQMPYPEVSYSTVEINDEALIHNVKKAGSRGNVSLEIDICYSPSAVQESRTERGYYPRLFVIADKNNGTIIDFGMHKDIREDVNVTLNKLINLCLNKGVPKEIQVRDDKMTAILQDFCRNSGINLKKVKHLRVIDYMIDEMANRFMY